MKKLKFHYSIKKRIIRHRSSDREFQVKAQGSESGVA